jgi:hypothetical protein
VLVAPVTFNTVNQWAAGINDTLALGLLNELPITGPSSTNALVYTPGPETACPGAGYWRGADCQRERGRTAPFRRREHWLATSRAVSPLGTYVLHVGRSSTDRPARSRFGSAGHHILRIGHKRGRSRQ